MVQSIQSAFRSRLIYILKRLPLRVVLSIPFIVQIVVIVGLVGYLSHINGQQAVNNLAQQLMSEVQNRVQQHLQAYTGLPQQIVKLVADDIELGLINLETQNLQALDAYFLDRIQTFDTVSFIYVGDQQGKFIGAGPVHKNGEVSYLIEVTDGTTDRHYISYAVNKSGQRTRPLNAVPNYDPRQRPWYQAAVAAGKATWSEIYPFIGEANEGLTITAVKPFRSPSGLRGVAAVDLYLNDIERFLKQLKVAKSGQIFILEPTGVLVASSTPQPTYSVVNQRLQRVPALESDNPLMRSTVSHVIQQFGGLDQIDQPQQLKFNLEGAPHFVQITPWQDGFGLDWVLMEVVPESDFMTQIYANTRTTFLLCAVAMLVAITVSVMTARWVITPIRKLNRAAKQIAKGQWKQPIAIHRADEVGELANSFNQMAAQLQLSFDALHQEQQQLAKFLEAIPVGICVVEPSGSISYMNQTAQHLLGQTFKPNLAMHTLKHFYQTNLGANRPYPPDQLPSTRALHGENITVEDIEIHLADRTVPLEVRATPVFDASGTVNYAILAFQDISERKQAEKLLADYNRILEARIAERTVELTRTNLELERAKQAAEAANHAKSAFLANMSHELRTPLNAILGFAQIMCVDPRTTPEQQHNLRIINRSGEHLLSLINNVLDLSKIEAGRVDLVEINFNLSELLETIDSILRQRAEAKGLQLQVISAPDVPQQVVGDANKLRQVLINLMSNGIKFTEKGSVTLRVSVIPNHSQWLSFEVSDTGIGIPVEEVDRIFDAFEQSSNGKIAPEGTGLGLTISHKFIELMGGTIAVYSRPGQGSTFTVSLPLCPIDTKPLPDEAVPCSESESVLHCPESNRSSHRQITGLAPGHPLYRILIVDDQAENRELLMRMLTVLRLELREATNGEEAIRLWQQWQPDLILLDIYMPTMNGLIAAQKIRQLEAAAPKTTPNPRFSRIIALSASVLEKDRQEALAAGCNGFLGKPFQTSELYEVIAQQLELRYHYTEAAAPEVLPPVPSMPQRIPARVPSRHRSASLDFMPSQWRDQLYQAAIRCRDEQVIELLEQIPTSYSALADELYTHAQKFQFEMILQLLHGYSNQDRF
ncbi:response regulator [Leptolyngbya sp. NK1-12]|uniref:Circadian input-output histidine kinase CikA n=1 Tax=Leptolyngbya sp. NK1-12 TaxID=2547451 RepID=A0AA96WBP6_9CYAN|nr:response regulator [Leptolyngbya sp. NK1-12]